MEPSDAQRGISLLLLGTAFRGGSTLGACRYPLLTPACRVLLHSADPRSGFSTRPLVKPWTGHVGATLQGARAQAPGGRSLSSLVGRRLVTESLCHMLRTCLTFKVFYFVERF